MPKVLISVEGQTEETLVRDLLAPRFAPRGLYLLPVLLKTKRVPGGSDFKGGYLPYGRIRKELLNLLGDTSAAAVTTMYDYYALPRDFPGLSDCDDAGGVRRAVCIETSLMADIDKPKLRPYLQVHEFEALLFADPGRVVQAMGGAERERRRLERIRQAFPSPEEIDDGADTSPSHRIQGVFPQYAKALHGPQILRSIGLAAIRHACSHFDTWVCWLESLT